MPEMRIPALYLPEGQGEAVPRTVRRALLAAGVTLLLVALIPAGLLTWLAAIDIITRITPLGDTPHGP